MRRQLRTMTPLSQRILISLGFEKAEGDWFTFFSKKQEGFFMDYNLATKALLVCDTLHPTPVVFTEELVLIVQASCPGIIRVGPAEDNPYTHRND